MEQFERFTRDIPTLYSRRHAQMLYGLIRWLQPQSVVEVGTFHGYTALWMARALQDNDNDGVLHCIDDFSLLNIRPELLIENLYAAEVHRRVVIHNGKSSEVKWPERVDMAFIDGDHSLKGCTDDVNAAVDRGAVCVAVHDVNAWWGPRQWLEIVQQKRSWNMISVPFDSGMAVIMKQFEFGPLEFTEERYPEGRI